MGQSDWTVLTGGLDAASVPRGVTHGIVRPNGGGVLNNRTMGRCARYRADLGRDGDVLPGHLARARLIE